jgi:hypothetical protein
MAKKRRIFDSETINSLDSIYAKSKSRREFFASAKASDVRLRDYYLDKFYYDRKRGTNSIRADTSEAETSSPTPATTKTSELPAVSDGTSLDKINISVGSNKAEADSELKSIYKTMLTGNEPESSDESKSDNSKSSSSESLSDDDEYSDSYSNSSLNDDNRVEVNLKNPLAAIAMTINNKLLYGRTGIIGYRELDSNEENQIAESSKGVVGYLDKIADPRINYLFYSYLIPAVGRLDLYYDKVASIISAYVKKRKNNVVNADFKVESNNSKSEPEVSSSRYSQAQEQEVERWKAAGIRVDPSYDFSKDLDIVAYRDLRTIRNIGSSF